MDWTSLPWIEFNGLQWINVEKMLSRSRSRSRRSRPLLPRAGAGAEAVKNFHGSAALLITFPFRNASDIIINDLNEQTVWVNRRSILSRNWVTGSKYLADRFAELRSSVLRRLK